MSNEENGNKIKLVGVCGGLKRFAIETGAFNKLFRLGVFLQKSVFNLGVYCLPLQQSVFDLGVYCLPSSCSRVYLIWGLMPFFFPKRRYELIWGSDAFLPPTAKV